jgi:hypothetical protein
LSVIFIVWSLINMHTCWHLRLSDSLSSRMHACRVLFDQSDFIRCGWFVTRAEVYDSLPFAKIGRP